MPLRLPLVDRVVIGHRGDLLASHQDNSVVRAVSSQPKDALLLQRRGNATQLRPRHGRLPSFELKPKNDYTRFSSATSLKNAAAKDLRVAFTAQTLTTAVQQHIRQGLQSLGTNTAGALVLVGTSSGSDSSALVSLAAVASVAGSNAQLLFQKPASAMAPLEVAVRHMEDRARSGQPNPLAPMLTRNLSPEATSSHDVLIALTAAKGGTRFANFDPDGGGAADQRLVRTAQTIQARLQNAQGPVVVLADTRLLPALHDHLEGQCDLVALSAVEDSHVQPPSSDLRRIGSYLFANDDILKVQFRATPGTQVDLVQYARGLVDFDNRLPVQVQTG